MSREHPRFPAIYHVPELGGSELRVLSMIDNLKARIRASTGSDGAAKRWLGPLRRNLSSKALVGSNSIEGINVTKDEADALVANEEPPLDQRTETWLSGQGWNRAMTYVLQAASDKTFVYSESLLKTLHFMMLEHEIDKRPGRWRETSIFVYNEASDKIVYEGPDAEQIPGLVEALVESLNASADVPRSLQQRWPT